MGQSRLVETRVAIKLKAHRKAYKWEKKNLKEIEKKVFKY